MDDPRSLIASYIPPRICFNELQIIVFCYFHLFSCLLGQAPLIINRTVLTLARLFLGVFDIQFCRISSLTSLSALGHHILQQFQLHVYR